MSAATVLKLTQTQCPTYLRLPGWATGLAFLAADALAILSAYATAVAIFVGNPKLLHETCALIPLLLTVLIIGGLIKLYPGGLVNAVEEFRLLTIANISGMLLAAFVAHAVYDMRRPVVWSFIATIPIGVFFGLACRWAVRRLCSGASWWGVPTILVGPASEVETVRRSLVANRSSGIRVVETLAIERSETPFGTINRVAGKKARYAIVVLPIDVDSRWIRRSTELVSECKRIILAPQAIGLLPATVTPCTCFGLPGLEVKRELMRSHCRIIKRSIDLGFALILAILLVPVILAIALAVKCESPGPALYGHRRIGKSGRFFKVWKFRTMIENADQSLEQYLKSNPALRQEWKATHKLKNDPRVTRIGKILRQTSLDEVPQIWNVIRGQMSLVGPRPIVAAEVCHYGEDFDFYRNVRPGITGLWQVSGRSDTTYRERVGLDVEYVQNWSLWLDVYLLGQTIGAVLRKQGAY